MEYVTLNTGAKMPQVGFGVFQIPDADECKRVVLDAIKAGYRSFDTALVTREELFITSKMWVQDMKNYDMAKKAIETSLEKLGLEYLDLYLLHQAMGDYFSAYRAMEDAYKEGKLKAIGVSNFFPNVLMNLVENVELENMKELGIQPEAWAPLAEGKHGIFTDPELTAIGAKYGKSAAQVVLRWNVQRGVVILPKSTKPERMAQNKDLFDFTLTDEEMEQITAKSLDHSEIINHFDPKLVQFLNRRNIHD